RLRLRYALFPPTPPFLCSCSAPPRDLHSFPTRRSSDLLTCATVSPRYSVRTAPFELWNSSLSSAIAASLSALAMRPPSDYLGCRSEEHTSELQSRENLVCRLLLEKKK